LSAALETLDLTRMAATVRSRRVLIVAHGESADLRVLRDQLCAQGTDAEMRTFDAPAVWVKLKEGDEFGGGTVPRNVIDPIVEDLAGAKR
ncbi:MAG: hypothetical protein HY568_02065, partial [Candidatus Latescibacteria bacterium]|nr:hypothetical protein [Candidatus Latescibacterota bacterium]